MSWLDELYAGRLAASPKADGFLREKRPGGRGLPGHGAPSFLAALLKKPAPAVIAEIKFASPSLGVIRGTKDVEAVAESYAAAGAQALSVLTEEEHFGGHVSFIGRAKRASGLPVLRKDFLVSPQDVAESKEAGADAALVIARFMSRGAIRRLLLEAAEMDLAVLVEVHGEEDLSKIEGLPVQAAGVNHRDLETLELDMGLSGRLAPLLPARAALVAESGLSTGAQLRKMAALGYDAVLVGSAFMRRPEPGAALAAMMEDARGSGEGLRPDK